MQQSMIKCKSWFSRTHWAKIVFVLSVARCAYIHFTVSPSPSPAPSRLASHILSLSTRSRIIQAFRYIRAWLADFDIKCERANTRSTRGPPPYPFPSHSTEFPISIGLRSFFLLISFHSNRTRLFHATRLFHSRTAFISRINWKQL